MLKSIATQLIPRHPVLSCQSPIPLKKLGPDKNNHPHLVLPKHRHLLVPKRLGSRPRARGRGAGIEGNSNEAPATRAADPERLTHRADRARCRSPACDYAGNARIRITNHPPRPPGAGPKATRTTPRARRARGRKQRYNAPRPAGAVQNRPGSSTAKWSPLDPKTAPAPGGRATSCRSTMTRGTRPPGRRLIRDRESPIAETPQNMPLLGTQETAPPGADRSSRKDATDAPRRPRKGAKNNRNHGLGPKRSLPQLESGTGSSTGRDTASCAGSNPYFNT